MLTEWIYKQLEKEQNIRTFTFDLIKYLNELGQNTNGLIATLSAIKSNYIECHLFILSCGYEIMR